MLQLPNKTRDEITKWLRSQLVPSEVGAGMIQVANMLSNLKDIPDEAPKKEEPKKK